MLVPAGGRTRAPSTIERVDRRATDEAATRREAFAAVALVVFHVGKVRRIGFLGKALTRK